MKNRQKIGLFLTVLVLAANFVQAGPLRKPSFIRSTSADESSETDDLATRISAELGLAQDVVSNAIPKLSRPLAFEFEHLSQDPTGYLNSVEGEVDHLIHHSSADTIMTQLKKPETLSKLAIYSLTHSDAVDFLDQILCKLNHCSDKDRRVINNHLNQLSHPAVINEIVDGISNNWMSHKIKDWLQEKRGQLDNINRSQAGQRLLNVRGGGIPDRSNRLAGQQSKIANQQSRSILKNLAQKIRNKFRALKSQKPPVNQQGHSPTSDSK